MITICGIAGFALNGKSRGEFPADALCRELLLEIETRGKDATGFLSVSKASRGNKPKLQYTRLDVTAEEFIKTHTVDAKAHTALLHTRNATQGHQSILVNNHPVMWDSCFVTHNGHIGNDDEVLKEALGDDWKNKRVGEVDSFAIPVALKHHGWAEAEDIKQSLHMLRGGFAIAAVDPIKQPGKLLLAKGVSSPLHVLTTPQGVFWASTEDAIINAWGKVLGTPPKAKAKKPGDFGMQSLNEGDFWHMDTSKDNISIVSGKFDINRNYGTQHQTGPWQYRPEEREWTCWPDTKNCIFAEDCGHCHDNSCKCYEGNFSHPKLNNDVTFKYAINQFSAFKRHCEKFGLGEEVISRDANPTRGTTIPRNTTGSNGGTHGTTRGTVFNGTGARGNVVSYSKCFYCGDMKDEADMIRVTTGTSVVFKCAVCITIQKHREEEGEMGHDPILDPIIKRRTAIAKTACDTVDQAIAETAFEYKVEVNFVRYVLFYQPKASDQKDQPDYFAFCAALRENFNENIKLINELRQMEAAK